MSKIEKVTFKPMSRHLVYLKYNLNKFISTLEQLRNLLLNARQLELFPFVKRTMNFIKKWLNNWILFLHQKGLIWGGKKLQKQIDFFQFSNFSRK